VSANSLAALKKLNPDSPLSVEGIDLRPLRVLYPNTENAEGGPGSIFSLGLGLLAQRTVQFYVLIFSCMAVRPSIRMLSYEPGC